MEFVEGFFDGFPSHLADAVVESVSQYSISLLRDHVLIGSGTLVFISGRYGVLTAHHVADIFFGPSKRDLGINYRKVPHCFHVAHEDWDCISISPGLLHPSFYNRVGPDLAFLWLKNADDLWSLEKEKSFYNLELNRFTAYENGPVNGYQFLIAGAPGEEKHEWGERGTPAHRLVTQHLLAYARRVKEEKREGFDFWILEASRGVHDSPFCYKGVSGGGVWLPMLEGDPDIGPSSYALRETILAGTVTLQNPRGVLVDLVAHGPHSIFDERTLNKIREYEPPQW